MNEYDKINFANKVLAIIKVAESNLRDHVERKAFLNDHELLTFQRKLGADAFKEIHNLACTKDVWS